MVVNETPKYAVQSLARSILEVEVLWSEYYFFYVYKYFESSLTDITKRRIKKQYIVYGLSLVINSVHNYKLYILTGTYCVNGVIILG
jgi:hypothetical protein